MERFNRVTAVAAPMLDENINTDAIIPTPWIINVGDDWGNGLFRNHRYGLDGKENAQFVLNRPRYRACRILVAGRNFGCGSSREEAVWALAGYGIRAVIAPSFGDIFFENAFKNGLLPVVLPPQQMAELAADVEAAATPTVTVDLEHCTVTGPGGKSLLFTIDATRREPLLQGRDDIDATLAYAARIDDFQTEDRARRPWIYRNNRTQA